MNAGPNSRSLVRQSLRIALAVAAFAASVTGCAGEPAPAREKMFRSGPTFESVTQLRSESDVIVVGRVTGIFSREEDDGGNGTGVGVPLVFYNFEVDRSVGGPIPKGTIIQVGWVDPAQVDTGNGDDMTKAGPLVLFADEVTPQDAPGVDTVDLSYFPLSGANGVFSLDTDTHMVTAWSMTVRTLNNETDAAPESSEPRSWPEDEFMRAAGDSAGG